MTSSQLRELIGPILLLLLSLLDIYIYTKMFLYAFIIESKKPFRRQKKCEYDAYRKV